MKKISMNYREYQDDLSNASVKGYAAAFRDILSVLAGHGDNLIEYAIEGNTDIQKVLNKLGIEWKPKPETEKPETKFTMDDIPF